MNTKKFFLVFLIFEILTIYTFVVSWSLSYRSSSRDAGRAQSVAIDVRGTYDAYLRTQRGLEIQTHTTLLFVGDIMLSRSVGNRIREHDNPLFPFEKVREFVSGADIAFGNLEGPVSDRGRNQGSIYSFRADPRVVEGLRDAGFDVLSLANNHIWDWGADALVDTVRLLSQEGIISIGAGKDYEQANVEKIIEKNGTTFAFLAYTDLYPRSFAATPSVPGISLFDTDAVIARIKDIKTNKRAEVIVVSFHWGEEYEKVSNESQRSVARKMIDAGADLVVGHHPHVSQEVEKYNGKYIFYSLGNFVFDQNFSKETMEGLVIKTIFKENALQSVEFYKSKLNRSYQVESIESFMPAFREN